MLFLLLAEEALVPGTFVAVGRGGFGIGDHLVDGIPVRQSAEVLVIDIDVGYDLAGKLRPVGEQGARRLVSVDGKEFQSPVLAEL